MPMTEQQLLLGQAAEECAELAQRFLKAQRFGLEDRQSPGHGTNRERIIAERNDLVALLTMLDFDHVTPEDREAIREKQSRVITWMRYSREQGQVE